MPTFFTSFKVKKSKGKGKVKVRTLDIAPLRSESPPQKRSGMARVLKGSHSFTLHTQRSSAVEMSHPAFTFPTAAGTQVTRPLWMAVQVTICRGRAYCGGRALQAAQISSTCTQVKPLILTVLYRFHLEFSDFTLSDCPGPVQLVTLTSLPPPTSVCFVRCLLVCLLVGLLKKLLTNVDHYFKSD